MCIILKIVITLFINIIIGRFYARGVKVVWDVEKKLLHAC